MDGAPWYLIRNQVIIATNEGPLKLKDTDRYVLLHNTLVNTESGEFQNNEEHMLNAYSRNNLFVAAGSGGSHIWDTGGDTRSWRSDLDYDGFDWGSFSGDPFDYGNQGYEDVPAFAAGSGLEAHGIRFQKELCFETLNFVGPPPVLSLKAGCNAIDAGVVLPNINEDYVGDAPDLGAYERGAPPTHYGPREGGQVVTEPPEPPSGLQLN
jgi:hypothetical protein